jgi:hypothetical protein
MQKMQVTNFLYFFFLDLKMSDRRQRDNKADVCNPNNPAGGKGHAAHFGGNKPAADNHANQINPNNAKNQGGRK